MNSVPLENSGEPDGGPRFDKNFWKMTGSLVGVQFFLGLLVIYVSLNIQYEARFDYTREAVREQINNIADEIERRAFPPGQSRDSGRTIREIPETLIMDLSTRFADPIILLNPEGNVVRTIQPDPAFFKEVIRPARLVPRLPVHMMEILGTGRTAVQMDFEKDREGEEAWACTPIYNVHGELKGGLLVTPLRNNIKKQMRVTREAFIPVVLLVAGFSMISGFLLSYYFTGMQKST